MNKVVPTYDAIVIGGGAGGLFSSALLAERGYRTLMVERLDDIGGRASTRYIDGFSVNTGAMGIELGTETETVFKRLGAKLDVRRPKTGIVVRIGKKDVNVSSGVNGFLVRFSVSILKIVLKTFPAVRPGKQESIGSWLSRYTSNKTVHLIIRNFVGSIFAVGPHQLPADLFLYYMTHKGAFKKFGFPPGGTVEVWRSLVDAFKKFGGKLMLSCDVEKINFDDQGRATGVTIRQNGESFEVRARIVVSDVGPAATLRLAGEDVLGSSYAKAVADADNPTAIITVYFASRERLAEFPGFACFSDTRRLCYAANFSDVCPENSPPGWYLYCGASVPHPASGDFSEQEEIDLLMQDLKEQFKGFSSAKILDIIVTRGDWPAQRVIAGSDLHYSTPVPNLFNVGDGVKVWGNAATSACAQTALLVVDEIQSRYPVR